MAVNGTAGSATEGYLLPCGRDVEQVWERLDEPDAHGLDCTHCQDTRLSLTTLRSLTRDLADEDIEPSFDLTGRIMAAVRADIRRHDLVPAPAAGPGELRVSAQAVAAVLRFVADGVTGVRARRCRVRTASDGEGITVEMSVAVSYQDFVLGALEEVRTRVAAAVDARVGLRLHRLDLHVDDVYDAWPHTGGTFS